MTDRDSTTSASGSGDSSDDVASLIRRIDAIESMQERLERWVVGFGAILFVGAIGDIFGHSAVLAAVAALGIWGEVAMGFVSIALGSRLRPLTDRLKHAQALEIARLTESTARANWNATNAQWKLSPRTFTGEQRQELVEEMSEYVGYAVELVAGRGEAEAVSFALEIGEAFKEAGWRLMTDHLATAGDDVALAPCNAFNGIAISTGLIRSTDPVTDRDRELWLASGTLAKFLRDHAFDAFLAPGDPHPGAPVPDLRVVVCRKLLL